MEIHKTKTRLVLLLVFFFTSFFSGKISFSQGISSAIIKGGDWRICGTYLEKDTLEFKKMESKVALFDCKNNRMSQLLFSTNNVFQFILWDEQVPLVDVSGFFEVNDANGEIRFYFDDGRSRDFILLFLNSKKMILVDKNY